MARRRQTLVLTVLVVLGALLGAGPAYADGFGLPEPHSPNAESISTTYWVLIAIVAILVVVVNAALLAALVRFRERRGREVSRFAAGRGALRPVSTALAVLALAVFVFGVVMTSDVRELEPSGPDGLAAIRTAQVGVKGQPPASLAEGEQSVTGAEPTSGAEPAEAAPLEIDAISQQWLWRFEYPGGQPGRRTFSYGELVVPVDTAVVLNITSTDVLHSWWVPELGGQVQATPGKTAQTWFKADEVGRYEGRSTIFSGSAYPAMRAWVRVVEVPEYEAYVEERAADLSEAQGIVSEGEPTEEAAP